MPLTRWTRIPNLEARPPDSHKGNFGKIVIVAGSRGMAGAAALTASAALRSGVGLVTVATPRSIAGVVTAIQPCAMTLPLDESDGGTLSPSAADALLSSLDGIDALAIGPGMGHDTGTEELVRSLLGAARCPVIVDADGLNNLATRMETLEDAEAPVVLTPHPGEMRRLDPDGGPVAGAGRERTAAAFAARWECILVLKGHRSVVTDGRRVYVNATGNPGMASGGAGDVLTGMLAGLIGQGLKPFDGAVLGTYLHGFAGDLAAREIGQVSLIASDLVNLLPVTFRRHLAAARRPVS